MSNVRRAARLGLSVVFASMALVLPVAASAASATNHPTFGADFLVGTPGPDIIVGRRGPDTIFGLAGDDILLGNHGADRIFAGRGMDIVVGGPGPDLLRGGLDPDTLNGGWGNDLILAAGDGAIDTISCGRGPLDVAIVDPEDVVAADCEFVWVRDPEA